MELTTGWARFFRGASLIYLLVALFVALLGPPEDLAFLPAVGYVIPGVLLLAVGFASRERWSLGMACCAALLVAGGILEWHRGTAVVGVVPGSFSVLTWNIDAWRSDLPAVAGFMREQSPDVICLQEMHKGPPQRDPRPPIRNAMKGWHWLQGGNSYRNDLAILSKFPLHQVQDYHFGDAYGLLARVDTPTAPIQVLVVHLHRKPGRLPRMDSGFQWSALEATLESLSGPLLLVGDFNAPAFSRPMRGLRNRYLDAFGATNSGPGYTFPSRLPCWRLDYVLLRGLRPLSTVVLQTQLSDHRPILARLRLAEAP